MNRLLLVLLLGAVARAEGLADRIYVVSITTERSTSTGTERQTLAAPALPVAPGGLLMAVGFAVNPPRENQSAVIVRAYHPDGRELTADLLGADDDLNCTYFRLTDKSVDPPDPVSLTGANLEVGEKVWVLGRHGALMKYAPRRLEASVEALVRKPKTLYALRPAMPEWRSSIVSTRDGRFVGFVDTRSTSVDGSGIMLGVGTRTTVVVPADIYAQSAQRPPDPRKKKVTRKRSWIGVNLAPVDPVREEYFGLKGDTRGALVTGLSAGSPAAEAGILLHDIVQSIGDYELTYERASDWAEMLRSVQELPLGEKLVCRVLRFAPRDDGGFDVEVKKLTMVLKERPVDFEDVAEVEIKDLGIFVKPVTDNWRRINNVPEHLRGGVVVIRMARGSPAQLAGLRINDLVLAMDRLPIPDTEALKKLVAEARKARRQKVVLFVRRGAQTTFVAIEPQW